MHIHFVGIGGIGVSALARYYLLKKQKISGSDLVSSEIVDELKKQGAKIFIGPHSSKNICKGIDFVVYSPAVSLDNPEIKKARELKIKIYSYPQALGRLTKRNYTIAVSGTHGKSTTTAMIALIFVKAGLDPNVIIGTKLKEFEDSNCRIGKSRYLIIEADEWNASFLNYWPKIIVLTNIEKEHLDYYKNLNHILKTYKKYIGHLPDDGFLIYNSDDKNISKILNSTSKFQSLKYSLKQKEAEKIKKVLKVPGEHNIYNALAALTTARILEIPDRISYKALSEYKGAWRRFEEKDLKIENCKLKIISDYAHHPTEVLKTLEAVREKYPFKKIICVFQPHQYQRTYYLFNDFVKVFKKAPIDEIIITDIYDVAGRERKSIKSRADSKKLVERIKKTNVIYLPIKKIEKYIKENIKKGDILVIMGAGDIYKLADRF